MILVWSRRAIAESSPTGMGCWKSQWTTDFSRNSGTYIVFNSHVTSNNFSFSLVMVTVHVHVLLVPHWLLAQAHFYGKTYMAPFTEFNHVHRLRWYSDNPLVIIIFGQMKLSTTSADTATPAGHGDIPLVTPILSMYLVNNTRWV